MADPCEGFEAGECEQALRELYHFLDGQLTVERRTVIQTHIDGCGHCLSSYSFEMELRHVVSKRCHDQVPQDLRARILDALRDAQGRA